MKALQLIDSCSKNIKESDSGIYMIMSLGTQRAYIGQSKNVKRRWTEHKKTLKSNKHKNLHLQRIYNKYGQNDLRFVQLESAVGNLTEREIYYITILDEDVRINMNAVQDVIIKTLSDETKQKISNKLKGKKLSPEHYANVAASNKGRNLGL